MATEIKLNEVLKQDNVQLNEGDFLAPVTRAEGYVQDNQETVDVKSGKHLYYISNTDVGINVTPVDNNADGTGWVVDYTRPVIIQEPGKITYMTGRNHPYFDDVYNGRSFHVVDNIPEGEEHRHVVTAFIDYVRSEYSAGVNEFQIERPEYITEGTGTDTGNGGTGDETDTGSGDEEATQ